VDRDEVALPQQLVKTDEAHAERRGPRRLDVRVISNQPDSESRHPLGEQHPDAPEPDDADGLAGNLDTGVLRTLPLTALQRSGRGGGVAGHGKQQRHRLLGGRDDVGRRRVDHHHAAGGGGRYLDVVEADAGAGDDLELRCRGDRFGVDLRGAAHDQRVRVGEGGDQRGPVGAVDVADVEVVGEHLQS
jgi:hypothetical protein